MNKLLSFLLRLDASLLSFMDGLADKVTGFKSHEHNLNG